MLPKSWIHVWNFRWNFTPRHGARSFTWNDFTWIHVHGIMEKSPWIPSLNQKPQSQQIWNSGGCATDWTESSSGITVEQERETGPIAGPRSFTQHTIRKWDPQCWPPQRYWMPSGRQKDKLVMCLKLSQRCARCKVSGGVKLYPKCNGVPVRTRPERQQHLSVVSCWTRNHMNLQPG